MVIIETYKNEEIKVIRFFLKVMKCWPEDKTNRWNNIYFLSLLGPLALAVTCQAVYIITETRDEDPLTVLQGISDGMALATFFYKALYIRQHTESLVEISNILTEEFNPMEEKHVPTRIKLPRSVWIPTIACFFQCVASVVISTSSMWAPAEERKYSFAAPSIVTRNDLLFFTFDVLWLWCHVAIFSASSTLEACIICLSNLVREKSLTLRGIIQDLDKITDSKKRDEELTNIVKYHNLVCDVHERVENICSRPMLLQFLFFMIGVGTPTLRILLAELQFDVVMFLACYLMWVTSQVLIFFLLCDASTHAAGGIATEAYFAYRPEMTKDQGRKLLIVIAKAQRPLHFTARKMIKINRQAMLKLGKRSHSIYSWFLSMRKM